MVKRNRVGALLAAGALVMGVAAVTMAAPPTYFIEVTKTADPASVPQSGGTVEFSVWVENTGTGHFTTVVVDDGMAGCTMVLAGGDDGDAKLEDNETWQYACTVNDVEPDDTNTATVNACHSGSACNQSAHDAQDMDSVTLGDCECTTPPASQPAGSQPPGSQPPGSQPPGSQPPGSQPPGSEPPGSEPPGSEPPASEPPASEPPASEPPGSEPPASEPAGSDLPDPSGDQAGETDVVVTQAPTDTVTSASGGPSSASWMLVVAFGLLLASLVVVSPAPAGRKR